MISSFKDKATRDIAAGTNSSIARKVLPMELIQSARRKIAALARATSLADLGNIPGYQLEKLSGNRKGQYSIRINKQFRICFEWDGEDAFNVEIVDYH